MMALANSLEIARQTLLLQVRSRLCIVLGLAVLGLGALFLVVAGEAARHVPGDEFFGLVTYMVLFQFGVPLVVTYLGVGVVRGDLDDRTATYLFVRPISRVGVYLGKWLAASSVGILGTWLTLLMLWAAIGMPGRDWERGLAPQPEMLGTFLLAAALAVPPYAAVGALFGALFKRPIVATVAFVVGWEVIASNVPPQAGLRAATVADPVRRWLLEHLQATGELREMLVGSLGDLGNHLSLLGDPRMSLLKITVIVLVIGTVIYARREYDSRPRD